MAFVDTLIQDKFERDFTEMFIFLAQMGTSNPPRSGSLIVAAAKAVLIHMETCVVHKRFRNMSLLYIFCPSSQHAAAAHTGI